MPVISVIAVLIVIVAAVLSLQRLPLLRPIFRWLPVPLWCYALPMVASAAGWLPRTHEAYPILIRYWLPFTLALLLLGVNLTSIKTVGRMGLVATALGSIGIILGAPLAGWALRNWLPQEAWKGIGTLCATWTGGSMNLVAVRTVLETPEAIFTALIVVDAVIAYSWMALLMALSSHQIGLNRWLGAEPAQQKKEVLAIPLHTPHRFGSVVGGIAFALFLTIVSLFYSAHLPTSVLVSSRNGWAILLVSTTSLLSTLYKPIRHLGYSSSIMGQPALYIVLAAMGAQGNPTALWETPIWILLGLLTVAFHALWMLLGGKWLRIPLGILATASQANIGGVVSTPLVGAIYNQHLAAIGLLLALGCNAIGTYLGLISAALSRWLLGL